MIGRKDINFKLHTAISLDDSVPEDNFYRQVEDAYSGSCRSPILTDADR